MDLHYRIAFLLSRYTNDECTDQEYSELFGYLESGEYDYAFLDHIESALKSADVPGAELEVYRSEQIIQNILSHNEGGREITPKIPYRRVISRWAVAAMFVGLVGVLSFFLVTKYLHIAPTQPMVESLQHDSKRFVNTGNEAVQITLEDGSRITLQPAAALSYPMKFNNARREVLLEGDAFFDIAHNPQKPFLVYHGHLVTRVLGTSFYIRQNKEYEKSEVEVTHGRVEVYENIIGRRKSINNKGVIIMPNQKMIYIEKDNLFITSLVDNPAPILTQEAASDSGNAGIRQFDFEHASLINIVSILKVTYGIDIVLENEQLEKCLFSGDVGKENLYGKLEIICQAIGCNYEIIGTKILIKGNGCLGKH